MLGVSVFGSWLSARTPPPLSFLIIAKVWCCSVGTYMNKASESYESETNALWFMYTHWVYVWQHY